VRLRICPALEQNDYILTAPYDRIELEDLLSEFRLVRLSNIAMFRTLDEDAWVRIGTANGNAGGRCARWPLSWRDMFGITWAFAGTIWTG